MTVRSPKELQYSQPNPANTSLILLNAAPLNLTQTILLSTAGYDKVTIFFKYIHNAATSITVVPTASDDGVTFYSITAVDILIAAPIATGTNYLYQDNIPVTTNLNFVLTYPVNTFAYMKLTITAAAAAAADTLTATAIIGVGPAT